MRAPPRAPGAPIGQAPAGRAARATPARVRGAGRSGGGALCAAVSRGLRGAGRGRRRHGGVEQRGRAGLRRRVHPEQAAPQGACAPARPPVPRVRLALCAAHRPLLSPRRASWSTWSSGAAGPPSESPVRGRFPARASRPGWEPSHRRPGREVLCLGTQRTSADRRCPLFTSPRGASRAASSPESLGPGPPPRRALLAPICCMRPRPGAGRGRRGTRAPSPCPSYPAVT